MIRPSSSFSSSAPCGSADCGAGASASTRSAATSCFNCSTFPECGKTGRCVGSCRAASTPAVDPSSCFISSCFTSSPSRNQLIRQRPNALHHPRQPVAPLHRDKLLQANAIEKPLNIKRQNLPRPLPGKQLLQDPDQPPDDVRIRIRQKLQRIPRPRPPPPEQMHRPHPPVHP